MQINARKECRPRNLAHLLFFSSTFALRSEASLREASFSLSDAISLSLSPTAALRFFASRTTSMYLTLLPLFARSASFSLWSFSIATFVDRTNLSVSSSSLPLFLAPAPTAPAFPTANGSDSSSLTRLCHLWILSAEASLSKRSLRT
jgi:hypothetical protein